MNLVLLEAGAGTEFHGAGTGDLAGQAVSAAGDVNGDGFGDFIVGARDGASGKGAAFIIYGKASGFAVDLTLSGLTTEGVQLNGAASGDRAGGSVSGAGDVNGDGFADVIVGAAGADEGGTDRGAAYVVFGGGNLGATIQFGPFGFTGGNGGFRLQGVANNDNAGSSVSGAGDVNGDGLADVIVGAKRDGAGGPFSGPGAAYVVFGSSVPYSPFFPINSPGIGFTLDGRAGRPGRLFREDCGGCERRRDR